ncbi:LysM domain protein [Planctomycetes bacterium Pla163]|uniref:LysM domain protein n=1 Tax=Rohdeia mirabilis TaxID=2528008 RepID=A0A518CYM0_9BACT|nr:LysM domain protein [Planctomycetes bacterium Pla163]
MQPIERYGLVTLLFIIVAVVAIVAWDGPQGVDESNGTVAALEQEADRTVTRQGLPAVNAGSTRPSNTIASGERGNGLRSADQPGTRPQPVANDRNDRETAPQRTAPHNPFGGAPARGDDVAVVVPPPASSGLVGTQTSPPAPKLNGGAPVGSGSGSILVNADPVNANVGTGADRVGMVGQIQPVGNPPRTTPVATPPAVATPALPTGPLVVDSVLSTQLQREYGRSYRLFGATGLVQAFVDANPGIDVDRLGVGDTLRRPEPARIARAAQDTTTQVASAPAPTPAATPAPSNARPAPSAGQGVVYTIRPNDTLSGIAAAALGSASAYKQIEALNPGLVPERLRVGDRIVLPATANLAALGDGAAAANAAPVSVASNSGSGSTPRVR